MGVQHTKDRLRDVPGIDSLTMTVLDGRQIYVFDRHTVALDVSASDDDVMAAIRKAVASSPSPAAANAGEASPISGTSPATISQSAALLPAVTVTEPKAEPMTNPAPASFAASLRALVDEARNGIVQAQADGRQLVQEAVGEMVKAKDATLHVSKNMAGTIKDEAASVMSELGQISNDLGV